MTFTGSPEAKYSKASLTSASANLFETSGFKSTFPLATSARALGYRLQYRYTPMISISRRAASCNRTGTLSVKLATTQTVPPEVAALMHKSSADGTPQHSKQQSN